MDKSDKTPNFLVSHMSWWHDISPQRLLFSSHNGQWTLQNNANWGPWEGPTYFWVVKGLWRSFPPIKKKKKPPKGWRQSMVLWLKPKILLVGQGMALCGVMESKSAYFSSLYCELLNTFDNKRSNAKALPLGLNVNSRIVSSQKTIATRSRTRR